MNLELLTGRVHVVFHEETERFGKQIILRFGNGYGVSVIQSKWSNGNQNGEGRYELAVAKFLGEDDTWHVCVDTPVTGDVIGWLDELDVIDYAQRVMDLPPHMKGLPTC